jgi:hypothetical protein
VSRRRLARAEGLACAGALLAACAASPRDYSLFRSHLPRSILVLPPENESVDVNASYSYLSTISRPLGEAGYYVFPVAVVDAFLKENGLPGPAEMHAVSLRKIREVIGADAVLYVTIENWGQKYQVLASTTVVKARAALVDTASGQTLWTGVVFAQESSSGGGDPIAALVVAAVEQIVDSRLDRAHSLSGPANQQMVFDQRDGLLLGPYHPDHEADLRGR